MIDPATGRLKFDLPGVVLGPELKRGAFLATPYGAACPVAVRNEPWCSFALLGVAWEGCSWNGHIYFHGSRLEMMIWAISFQDPSVAGIAEPDLVAHYDALLTRTLGPDGQRREFPWGTIGSFYDPRSDSTAITVHYGATGSPGTPRAGCLGGLLALLTSWGG